MGSNTLFHGFNCTDLGAVVNPNTQTASVCQPSQDVKCSDQKTSLFSETECLQNIANDLDYHRSMLVEYVRTLDQKSNSESIKELNSITNLMHELQQSCELLPKPESLKDKWSPSNSFEDRKDLCKQLKGFQVRTITINRALGYICAGEYKK
ncbi:interleukin-12 subunit alpha [Pangasianodon hypophthalmus]|uniref:interleukin-12 subunit alpha n=1 Tax=Pangasianodon hypophthalmus TaxID=310915 RepID=UPI002306F090|nr:interleukin-12 subunit alpha [Pangasianodon hypophthalmus]XP_053083574.1 interleukin-12 subunit alpha [Pangasianodon hypophthalmus]XP_053083575.1 interleukin-12 subunit alpha [Pangasianodon hypophthalmus]